MAAVKLHNGHLFPRFGAAGPLRALGASFALAVALAVSLALSAGLPPAALAAADCAGCASNRERLAQQRAAQDRHKEVLAKNMEYLSRLKPDDVSKAIKVKSNIVIIQLRLETMQNEISHAGDWIATHGCEACR